MSGGLGVLYADADLGVGKQPMKKDGTMQELKFYETSEQTEAQRQWCR